MRVEPALAQVLIYSLKKDSSKTGLELDINVSVFRDPLGHKTLTKAFHDGRAIAVMEWVNLDPRMAGLKETITLYVYDKIVHGKQNKLIIGFRDFHGRWIAPAVAEIIADTLSAKAFQVGVLHDGL